MCGVYQPALRLGHGKTEDRHEKALMSQEEAAKLSKAAGVKLTLVTTHSGDTQELKLPYAMTVKEATAITEKIAKNPDVEFAESNTRVFGTRVPTDTLYQSIQWNLQQPEDGVNQGLVPLTC